MMRWIIESSLKLRLVVVAIAALLMVFGFTQLSEMPVDALPEFSRPYVEIQIEALGLSAQEVEAMITNPLEADMLNGTPWAEEIRSVSLPGLASIMLIFEKGTDIMLARQLVSERLIEVFALPQVTNQFTVINPVSSAGRIMEIGLTSDEMSLIDMSVLARWTIVPRLMGVPGVANVAIWGERERQVQVQVDPERLRAKDLTLMHIIKTAGNSLWASPLSFLEASTPGTGGWVDTPNQRLGVRHILPIRTAEDLAEVPVEGAPNLRLGDVTTVVEDHQPLIGDAIIGQSPSLMLVVEKFPWANTMGVTGEVEKALHDLKPALGGIEIDYSLFRPATYLEKAVGNISLAVLIGGILLIIALFAFLFNWRSALIGTVAVLLSVFAAMTVLYVRGVTLNMMIIAGLMIALTAMIDNAIVDVENIVRRLRQAREAGSDKSTMTTILEAAVEMRSTILYATVIIMLVVVPALFLEGVTGAFWQPVATSYLLALVASMLVALTVTPALSLLFLGKGSPGSGDSAVAGMLRGIYNGILGWAARTPKPAFTAVIVIAIVGLVAMLFLRQESLLPEFKETDLVVRLQGSPGASHPAMTRIATLAARELRGISGVRNVSANVGRAIMSDKRNNINAGELWVSIDPSAGYETTVAAVKEVVAGYPGLSPEVLTNLQAKVRDELSGTGEALVVRVYGEDMNIIRKKAEEVERTLAKIDGIADPKAQYPQEMPTLEIEIDIEKAKQYNLKPGDLRRVATTMISGIMVGSLFEEQKVFNVVVWGVPEIRHSVSDIENLLVETPSGRYVKLKDVAHVRIAPSPTKIRRDAVARYVDVTANVRGRDIVAVAADIERGIDQIDFPLEYRAELLGEYADRLAAQNRVMAFAIAAAIGIFLLLQAFFRSWRTATAVFFTLPMALAGGALAAFITGGGVLSFGSLVGFLGVLIIAVRNAVTLAGHYKQAQVPGDDIDAEFVQQVTRERSAPILMTAITIALVFLPMAFFGGIAGLEILSPMAVVVLGGLVCTP
jgi:CzcA family heavy metal efflux pump